MKKIEKLWDFCEIFFLFQEFYAALDDPDSVKGCLVELKKFTSPTAHQHIIASECLGNYNEALPYHEEMTLHSPEDVSNHIKLVRCFLKLNQPSLAHKYIDGLISER